MVLEETANKERISGEISLYQIFSEDIARFLEAHVCIFNKTLPEEAKNDVPSIQTSIEEGKKTIDQKFSDSHTIKSNEDSIGFLAHHKKSDFPEEMLFLIGYLKNKYGNDFGMPQVRNLSSQEGKSSNKIYSIKEPAGIMYENEINGENIHYRFMSEFYPTETIEFTTKVGLNDLEKNLFESKHFIEDEEEINDFLIYDHEEGNYGIKVLENGKIAGVIYKNEQEDSLNSIRKIEQYLDKKLNKNA